MEWRLLTKRTAETLDAVVELIDWYRRRWRVEIFFRILKSGCRVEALQLGTLERLERALVIYLRLLQLHAFAIGIAAAKQAFIPPG
ncbi:MAG: transposase [Candidatus Contendobacter sp.]|nr:transposase [Candidatus Contendobacter sp.]